jgi:catechol 2,3-dioxygenase-like lactoylglutathione lyase family enzyme
VPITAVHQIALPSADLERSIAFYRDTLGASLIAAFTPPGLAFFRLGDVRLLLDHAAVASGGLAVGGAIVYLRVSDIAATYETLRARGLVFQGRPERVHRDEPGTFGPPGNEEWMVFFHDPDGNTLALTEQRRTA